MWLHHPAVIRVTVLDLQQAINFKQFIVMNEIASRLTYALYKILNIIMEQTQATKGTHVKVNEVVKSLKYM